MSPSRVKQSARAFLLIAWFTAAWLGPDLHRALAEPRHTAIALVSGGADAELHARLRAELAGLGWRVKEVPLGGGLALAQVARRAGTLAVLRVGRSAEGIEVWVAPEVDSEAPSEWIDVDARRPELAVLRAVEALRARFLELGIEPEDLRSESSSSEPPGSSNTPRSEPRAAPDERGKAAQVETPKTASSEMPPDSGASPPALELPELPRAPEALWLAGKGGIVSASKELGPSASLSGAVRFVHHSWLGLDLSVWWPPTASRITANQGFADVRAGLVAFGGELRDRRGAWTLAAGAGAGLAWLAISGHAAEARPGGHNTAVVMAMPFSRAAAELELARRLHLRAEGMLGFSLQHAHVLFDETTVASWGRPFLAGTLGLEWAAIGD